MIIENSIKKKIKNLLGNKVVISKIKTSGRNNLLFKLKSKKNNCILKIFLNKNNDETLRRELFFLDYCSKIKIHVVPKVLDYGKNYIFLSELKGFKPKKFSKDGFYQAVRFIFYLNRNKIKNYKFDAVENGKNLKNLIYFTDKKILRVSKLIKKEKKKEIHILMNQIKTLWKLEKKKLFANKSIKFTKIISPSDFGIHNTFYFKKKYFFHDFEYSGIDSLEKLVSDFVINPNSNFQVSEATKVVKKFDDIFNLNSKLNKNFLIIINTIIIRWSLILINSLFGEKRKQRTFSGVKENFIVQINKSKKILKKLI